MNTIGAHQRAPDLAGEFAAHALKIGLPGSFRLVIGVTHIVADGPLLAANRAASCHF
jgi:hypothetical protein